jgi:hypothetical protein
VELTVALSINSHKYCGHGCSGAPDIRFDHRRDIDIVVDDQPAAPILVGMENLVPVDSLPQAIDDVGGER